MADVAPTIAEMIGFDGLKPTDGEVLKEVIAPRARPPLVVTIVWDGVGVQRARRASALVAVPQDPEAGRGRRAGHGDRLRPLRDAPDPHDARHRAVPRSITASPGSEARRRAANTSTRSLGLSPANIRVPTLADLYDRSEKNRPITGVLASVNWHLGMIGQGSDYPGGDADPVVLLEPDGDLYTNPALYSLPPIHAPAELQEAHPGDGRPRTAKRTANGWDIHSTTPRCGTRARLRSSTRSTCSRA